MFLSVLAVLTIFSFFPAQSQDSMRRCMILPIQDSVGGAIGHEVFKKIERYFSETTWCEYESNSPILDILSNYRQNLHEHLENPDVLSVIAERTNAGSLIRIKLISDINALEVELSILGSNGEDLLFREELRMKTDDTDRIARQLINWLNEYKEKIPYDGIVTGVLGNQIVFNTGKKYGVYESQEIGIYRFKQKEVHPLLKEVVKWDREKIARGLTTNISDRQTQAEITRVEEDQRVESGDWVILKRDQDRESQIVQPFDITNEKRFGQLGTISFGVKVGRGTNNLNDSDESKKMRGHNLGINLESEVWITRNYWAGVEMSKGFGHYRRSSGEFEDTTNTLSKTRFKLLAGYKYLPMGFFYGPQINAIIGYARYGYGFDNNLQDAIVNVNYSGLLLGLKGMLPIQDRVRLRLEIDFIVSPSFSEDVLANGRSQSSSNYNLKIGTSYIYSRNATLDLTIDHTTSKTNFQTDRKQELKNTNVIFGTTITY